MADPIQDGNVDFSGGQNASIDPTRIQPNEYAAGINVSCSSGDLGPRWGNYQLPLVFSGGETELRTQRYTSYEDLFTYGRFQALIPYRVAGEYFLIAVVSGYFFLISQRTLSVFVLSSGQLVNPNLSRVEWSAAGRFLVIFDYPNRPYIIDGLTVRRSNEANFEVPRSRLGTQNQNRLFIANGGNEFTAGDPAGSTATPDAPITFEEISIDNSNFVGDVYQLPTTGLANEEITAIGFLQVIDGSTQIGPMFVATRSSITSFPTQNPRSTWLAGQFGSLLTYNAGVIGQRAHMNINSDLMFMDAEGQPRALSMSRDEQNRWSNSPISREVQQWTHVRDKELLPLSACTYFKNKAFFTVNPYRTNAVTPQGRAVSDTAFGGMVVLELDNQAGMGKAPSPVWAGLWTGLRPMDMCSNNERMFVMSKDDNSRNRLYEVLPSTTYDVVMGSRKQVRSRVYTKSYVFQDQTMIKGIQNMDIKLKDLAGDVDVNIEYKAEHVGKFLPWRHFTHTAPVSQCMFPLVFPEVLKQTIRDINLGGVDENTGSDVDNRNAFLCKSVQVRMTISAEKWKLATLKISAEPKENKDPFEEITKPVQVPADCNDDWII